MKTLILILALSTSLTAQYRGYILCNIQEKHVSIYVNKIWDSCEKVAKEYNIPLGLILAQCCLESGYGSSKYAKERNNHLGIKIKGVYASFDSFEDCLQVYAKTLSKECYKSLQPRTLLEWIESLDFSCCTYAVSKKYCKKLKYIIKKYNFDVIPYEYEFNNTKIIK